MSGEIKKAEKCFENGCEHCRICNRADDNMISEYYYWGVPCACYVKVCRQQSEKNRRVFMAYLNTKTKEKVFYQVQNGMPSGNPGTAITNSDCGVWMLIYCWLEMTQGTQYNTIEAFFEHVYACTYGDDVVVNISDEVIDWYNQDTLTSAMLRNFDIVFTDEKKTEGQVLKARTLSEVTFLKRSFVWNEYLQLYVAPMPEELLLDITNWVRSGSEDPRIITINNLKAVMCELSFISRECYNKHYDNFLKLINELCRRTRTLAYLDSYTGYLDKYRYSQLSPICD